MNQINEVKVFSLSVVPPANAKVYAYVWSWWDGTIAVTVEPRVEKKLNMGGNPTLAGRKLTYTCVPVMEDGQSAAIVGEIIVNNSPSIAPSPSVTVNDRFFPYATNLSITAYDLENDPFLFLYYLNGTSVGGGVTTAVGLVNGTWNGTYAGQFNGYRNVFSTTVANDRTITALMVDSAGGTTAVDFRLRGKTALAPQASGSFDVGGVSSDATTPSIQRIGEGQTVDFAVYAADPAAGAFSFLWTFAGSNGWTVVPVYTNGTTTPMNDGGFRNNTLRSVATETAGLKTAICRVSNASTNKFTDVLIDVELIANQVSASGILGVKANGVGASPPITISAGVKLEYSINVSDPDADMVTYRWTFTVPTGAIPASPPIITFRQWGQKVVLDTSGWPVGTIAATVTAYDRLGGQTAVAAPVVTIA